IADRKTWTGTASDLLRAAADHANGDCISLKGTDLPRNPRLLAGRLRRAQTFLRALGIEIAFSREGRAGTRTICIREASDNPPRTIVRTVSTVSSGWDEAAPKRPRNP